MKKTEKIYFSLLSAIIFLFISMAYPINALSDVHIIQDTYNSAQLPQNFRKTTDISAADCLHSLNIKGLDKLNISGSGQFTQYSLPLIIKALPDNIPIIDIDLREESHGFINGTAISFANSKNNANAGLTLSEVIDKENCDLSSIKINKRLTLCNTKKSIKPKTVQNENTFVKAENISYLRIPVTDGNLPNDTMVEYFIDFVKKQPENTWIHFHCKAGVGRTITFMIMYDIIKNCNEVSLNDIIARQLLLYNASINNSLDFFVGRRYEFLKKFYDKCRHDEFNISSLNLINKNIYCYNNLNHLKSPLNSYGATACNSTASTFNHNIPLSKYINSFDTINSDSNLTPYTSYIKNTVTPEFLYVISENDMTKAEQTMTATLQGLIASKSEKQIYILSPSEQDYEIWLKDLKKSYKVKYKKVNDPWLLLDKFKKYIDGYVLYSSVKEPSINNACTMASLNNSIAVDESIENILNSHGITNMIKDCRYSDKYWAFNNLWNSGLNHSTVIELPSDKFTPLRDYAVLSKSLVFY